MRSTVIKRFLERHTHEDLAMLYNPSMEVQVNVAKDEGTRKQSEYKGKTYSVWTDGISEWKSFRIPLNANSKPEDNSSQEIKFDFEKHVEGIGLTGWNFIDKCSHWVGFDFDAIIGHSEQHSKKLTENELNTIIESLNKVPWVTLRRSTGGRGLHLYVFLKPVIQTNNHNEHAALARSILGLLSILAGTDFNTKVDVCGSVLWIWHRKILLPGNSEGLTLIKEADEPLKQIPLTWKDHVQVVKGGRTKTLPAFIDSQVPINNNLPDIFSELSGQRQNIILDSEHLRLLKYLDELPGAVSGWDQDHKMLITHTYFLEKAFHSLSLKGVFKTISSGSDVPNDKNCFLFPMKRGGWVVRRFSPGTAEADTWDQDGQGWTRCYFNREPDFKIAARANDGIEHPKGGYCFSHASLAQEAANQLKANVNVPQVLINNPTKVIPKDDKLILEIDAQPGDPKILPGWLNEKGKWKKVFDIANNIIEEPLINTNIDDLVRHLVTTSQENYGWALKSDDNWHLEPLVHIKLFLSSLNYKTVDLNIILGNCITKPWVLVNKPFEDEFPGDRAWNRNGIRFRYVKSQDLDSLNFNTWNQVLDHCGEGLNQAIKQNEWCLANGVCSGRDYLMLWIASLFQCPKEPLPYLFLYGEQNSGKSILHEALSLLITDGCVRADAALINPSAFNAELEKGLICVVEETSLTKAGQAYNRIKDWVTARKIPIHRKGETPYTVENITHWIQTSNHSVDCPVFPGDTRITMIEVKPLKNLIPKKFLIEKLEKEAPDFLAYVLSLEIPQSGDRLNVPVIGTNEKSQAESLQQSALQLFLSEKVYYSPGNLIPIAEFFERFVNGLEPREVVLWPKSRFTREMPLNILKGRRRKDATWCYANISFSANQSTEYIFIREGEYLELRQNSPQV